MSSTVRMPVLLAILVLLVTMFYPTMMLNRVVAPEASLRSAAHWLWEPDVHPSPSPLALYAATRMGPRLKGINREGFDLALWNPHIGGGRPGWMASPEEGGAPLTLAAGFLAREGREWTALVALQLAVALAGAALLLTRLGLSPWAATAGGVAYALSGACAAHWLTWQGSAAALGPWMLLPTVMARDSFRAQAVAWWAAFSLALLSGPPAYAFMALALVMLIFHQKVRELRRWFALAVGMGLALALRAPALWLDRWGWERPPVRWPGEEGSMAGGLRALIDPFASGDPTEMALEVLVRPAPDLGVGFLGLLVVILASIGLSNREMRFRRILGVAAAASLGLLLLPEVSWLGVPAIPRPAGVLALAAAALAGGGLQRILLHVPRVWRGPAGALACVLVLIQVFPSAARRLPFASPESGRLTWPLAADVMPAAGGLTALLSTLPPDVAAMFGVPDVRAADLSREPRLAELLGMREDGGHPLSRALDPSAPRLGTEVILEPAALRLVSQQTYSQLEISEVVCELRKTSAGRGLCVIPVPLRGYRVGFALPSTPKFELFVRHDAGLTIARRDHALDPESVMWQWFTLPDTCATTTCTLEMWGSGLAATFTVAWDDSWLEYLGETKGVRIWRRRDTRPPVFSPDQLVAELEPLSGPPGVVAVPLGIRQHLPVNGPAPAAVNLVERSSRRWTAEIVTTAPTVVVARVKYRPNLWQVRVDGQRVQAFPADVVWTGILVPAGNHLVTWSVAIPQWVWYLASAGLVGILTLVGWRRR